MPNDNTHHAEPCAASNPAIASRLQSNALVGRVAELGSFGKIMKNSVVIAIFVGFVLVVVGLVVSFSGEHQHDPKDISYWVGAGAATY